jgi:hypothetical protein
VRAVSGSFGSAHLREEAQRHEEQLPLEARTCYAVVLTGDGIDRLSMAVVPPDGLAAQAPEAMDHVDVRVCTRRAGVARVLFQALSDGGVWHLALLAMDPAVTLPDDIVGLERAASLEIAGDARRHGMALLQPPVRSVSSTAAALTVPESLRAGRCYLFGVAASELLPGVELSLADDRGVVLASNTSGDAIARLFHCASRNEVAHLEVRTVAGRGEFAVLSFESNGASP